LHAVANEQYVAVAGAFGKELAHIQARKTSASKRARDAERRNGRRRERLKRPPHMDMYM